MPDFHGPIQHVTIAGTLWLLVALPVVASLFAARFALARYVDARAKEAVAIVSIGALTMSAVIAADHAWMLASRPADERFLVQHCWRLVRLGQLDASFDLALDPLSSTLSLVITGVGLAIVVYAVSSLKGETASARFFAWANALVAAMLLLVLADNLVVVLFGWEGVALCSWGLIGFAPRGGEQGSGRGAGSSVFLVSRIGDAALLLGIALFYWGFGGAWIDGDYAPDLNARFASVEVRPHVEGSVEGSDGEVAAPPSAADDDDDPAALPTTTGDGSLTLTSYSGAVVFMDDARTPLKSGAGDVLHSPFVAVPVRGGVHSFRVHPGGGLDDFLVTHVAFGGGREIALTPFGPTVSFREARDQIAARDVHGKATVRESLLAKRGWGATGLVTLTSLLLFLGVISAVVQLPLFTPIPAATLGAASASAILQACALGTAGIYLLARLGFFFALSPAACSVIVVTGAAIALFGAVAGLHAYELSRIVAASTAAQLGLMVLGVGVSGVAGAVFHLVCSALCTALLALTVGTVSRALRDVSGEPAADDIRRMGDLRRVLPRTAWAYAVGCLALTAAPIPGLAGFWSRDEVLVRILTARNLALPGYAAFFMALVATALTAFSLWRAYYLVFVGAPRTVLARVREPSGAVVHVAMALAAVSGLFGVAVGVSPRLLGKEGLSPIEDWLAPALRGGEASMASGAAVVEWCALLAMGLAAAAGWAFARARYEDRASNWEMREAASPVHAFGTRGLGVLAALDRTVAPLAAFASGLAAEVDQRVVDGFVGGAALVTRALAWVLGRVDDDAVDGTVRALSRGALRAGARVQVARDGRVQTYVYVLVLGILALALLPYWLR